MLESVQRWLARQLLVDQYAKLTQGGHYEDRISLQRVFVDLPVSDRPGSSEAEGRPADSGTENGLLNAMLRRKPIRLHRDSALRPNGVARNPGRHRRPGQRILLIGGPGQGKSTLGQFACQVHRAALLRPAINTLEPVARTVVRALLRSKLRPTFPLLPIRIVLPEAAAWMVRQSPSGNNELPWLLTFLAQQAAGTENTRGIEPSILLALLTEHPFLLVLDALDEVGAPDDRQRLVAAVRDFLELPVLRRARGQILVTTRPQGYTGELEGLGVPLRTWYLTPLPRTEALGYAEKLLDEAVAEHQKRQECLTRLKAGADEPATSRLFATPLQVTILTGLARRGPLPRERWALFKMYFDITYAREIERNTYACEILSERRSYIERIHQRVALLLQVEAEQKGGTEARIARSRLEEIADAVLLEEEVADDERSDLIQRMVRAAEQRLVFLVEPEPGQFGFEIRSFQEMMAAWALAEGSEELVELRLHATALAPSFRNVVLFLASKLFQESSGLRDALIQRVCPNLENKENSALAHETRAGARLALEILEEGAAFKQPKRARALMEQAVRVLDLPPDRTQLRLARVVSPDTVGPLQEALETRLGHNPDSALGAWTCLIEAAHRGLPWALEAGDRHFARMSEPGNLLEACSTQDLGIGWLIRRIAATPEAFLPGNLWRALSLSRYPMKRGHEETWVLGMMEWQSRLPMMAVFQSGHLEVEANKLMFFSRDLDRKRPTLQSLVRATASVPGWRGWGAAAAFEIAPSACSLAQALQDIAMHCGADEWEMIATTATWPLRACLRGAEGADQLLTTAKALLRGELGDLTDWQNAETAWWHSPLDEAAIVEPSPPGLPWNPKGIRVSPPLAGLNWPPRGGRRALSILARGFNQARKPWERSIWAEACLQAVFHGGSLAKVSEDSLLAWASALRSNAFIFLHPSAIMRVDRKLIALLDALGSRRLRNCIVPLTTCLEAYEGDPHRTGLLFLSSIQSDRLLYYSVARDSDLRKLDQTLAQQDFESDLIRADAAIVRVKLGRMVEAEVPGLVARVRAQAGQEPALWSRFFNALQTGPASIHLRQCLLDHSVLPGDAPEAAKRSRIAAVEDTLAFQRSGLDNHPVWDFLRLPLPRPRTTPSGGMTLTLPREPVVIHRLHLDGIRIFDNLTLEFAKPEPDSGQWILLIGDNGVGKSTVLRSIVLALRDLQNPKLWPKGTFASPWRAVGLPPSREGRIHLTLPDWGTFQTTIRQNGTESFQQSRPELRHSRILPVFAYGCRRSSALGGASRAVDLSEDDGPEIASLFDEGAPLIHAETWLKEWHGERDSDHSMVFQAVRAALLQILEIDAVEIRDRSVWVSGAAIGQNVPFAALSDGYLTTAGWFLDLLARWLELAHRHEVEIDANFTQHMTGLVLLDEIDLHLHPRWQIEVIARVKALLPRMTFVMSTHNPLTLVGARPEEIWVLSGEEGRIIAEQGTDTPMLLTGGQIFTQYFGIHSLYPSEIGSKLRRYGFLSSYAARNDQEQAELEELRRALQNARVDPGWEEVPRTPRSGASEKATRKQSP